MFGAARCSLDFYFKNDDKERVVLSLVPSSRAGGWGPSAGRELRHEVLGACPAHRQLSGGFRDP